MTKLEKILNSNSHPAPTEQTIRKIPISADTTELLVNMGPQHPSTHGVLRLIIKTKGELVKEVLPVIGYLHRCAEKTAENLTYLQYVAYTDRLDYLSSMNNNLAYSLAVEKLLGITAPPRAQYIRVIMAELNRIASHLVAIGTYGLDLGAVTPFLYCFREREEILYLFELVCGARMTYNYIRPGGVARDINTEFIKKTNDFLKMFPKRIKEYNDILSFNQIFINRTAGLGILPADLAIAYGVTGPVLRASGVNLDLRKSEPYSGYDKFDFKVCLGENIGDKIKVGDTWNRYFVRVKEMEESCKIIKQAIEGLPEGEFMDKTLKKIIKPKAGEIYSSAENPRGILGFYIISDGTDKPYRIKIRAPSFCNLSVLPEITKDLLIADLVAVLGSLDIVLGEIDR